MLPVLGRGPHGLADSGKFDKQGQQHHDNRGCKQNDKLRGSHDVGIGLPEFKIRDQAGKWQKIGCLGKKHIVLKENGHSDGADQGR